MRVNSKWIYKMDTYTKIVEEEMKERMKGKFHFSHIRVKDKELTNEM